MPQVTQFNICILSKFRKGLFRNYIKYNVSNEISGLRCPFGGLSAL